MYKALLACLFLTFITATATRAQSTTTDSTAIKMAQFKQLHDLGVISDDEYNKAIRQLQNLPEEKKEEAVKEKEKKLDSAGITKIKDRSRGRITAGAVALSLGAAITTGAGLYYSLKKLPADNPNDNQAHQDYQDAVVQKRNATIALGILGGGITVAGAVLLGLGLKDRAVYRHNKTTVTINVGLDTIGFAYNF